MTHKRFLEGKGQENKIIQVNLTVLLSCHVRVLAKVEPAAT